jgi:hypothetical protein
MVERSALSRALGIALVLALTVAAWGTRAAAQDGAATGESPEDGPGESPADAYEAHVRVAVAAYESRDVEGALAAFTHAFEILPTPRVLRGIAMCQIELGLFADAHRALAAALDADHGERAFDDALRANVETVLLPLVRTRIALWVVPAEVVVTIDGAEVVPDQNRVVAVDPGIRELTVRADDGRTAQATVEVRAGHVGPLPVSLPEPPPPEPAVTDAAPRAEAESIRVVPAVSVVQDAGLGDYTPHEPVTRFALWAHGTLGAWQGGREYSPAAGFGLTVALMTRFLPELSMGGQLEGTWAGLLEPCGPYASGTTAVRTSETCGWYRTSVRIAIEAHAPDMPISFVLAGGPGIGFRAAQTLDGAQYVQSMRADAFVAIDFGFRWYVVDDVLFLGADVRSAIGDYADVGAAVLLGAQIP